MHLNFSDLAIEVSRHALTGNGLQENHKREALAQQFHAITLYLDTASAGL